MYFDETHILQVIIPKQLGHYPFNPSKRRHFADTVELQERRSRQQHQAALPAGVNLSPKRTSVIVLAGHISHLDTPQAFPTGVGKAGTTPHPRVCSACVEP